MTAQGNVYLTTGSVLRSNEGNPMMTLTASTVERHDTVGGACSRESNTLRYGHHTNHQHACVDNFLHEHVRRGMGKRDMVPNINFFMNVPVEAGRQPRHRRRHLGAGPVRRRCAPRWT